MRQASWMAAALAVFGGTAYAGEDEYRIGPHFEWWAPKWDGAGGNFGSSPAFGAHVVYSFADELDLRPSFEYFFGFSKQPSSYYLSAFALDIEFLWRFLDHRGMHAHPVHPYFGFGLGVDFWFTDTSAASLDPSVGPDILGGVDFEVSRIAHLFVELEYKFRFDSNIKLSGSPVTSTNASGFAIMFGINFRPY